MRVRKSYGRDLAAVGVISAALVVGLAAPALAGYSNFPNFKAGYGNVSVDWVGCKNFNYSINVHSYGAPLYTTWQGVRNNSPDSAERDLSGSFTRDLNQSGRKDGSSTELCWTNVRFKIKEKKAYQSDPTYSTVNDYR